MSKIKIKNFGPIKDGLGMEWMDIKKVTLFIGNQGSGKSTVAKLASILMWLEKALIRGDMKAPVSNEDLITLFIFHRIEDYLKDNTEVEYQGANYYLQLVGASKAEKTIEASLLDDSTVNLPKIMYVPAERNFLSSIETISKVSNLIVGSLQNYSIEFRNAQLAYKNKKIVLPINNTSVVYNPKDDENYLEFEGRRLRLSHASSGFHSIVPLHWVTQYLSDFVKQDEKILLKSLSTDQTVRRNRELNTLNALNLDEEELRAEEKKINSRYVCNNLVNIVEEPEQNLYPASQRLLLNSLLAFNNGGNGGNKLIMTTHSPYMLVYITLCVEADRLAQRAHTPQLKSMIGKIVPLQSTIAGNDLAVYQLDETKGTIEKLMDYKGLPSDENKLNESLGEASELFSKLLDIEDLCQ